MVIPLSDYETNLDIQQLITNSLQFRYGVRIDMTVCQELQRLGRFLLLLDGFDEMASRVDPDVVRENFREINKISRIPENVFLVTCRTHFFRDKVQAEVLADFEVIYVPEWGESELREYLQRRFGDKWEQQLDRIYSTHNLAELAQTPLFLEMISETLPTLGDQVYRTELYKAYTDKWIEGQSMRRGARLEREERHSFVVELAMKLFRDDRVSCHYSEFVQIIRDRFQLNDAAEIDYLQNDVRNCTFVTRNASGNYEFRHKSFMEYFVAQGLAAAISADDAQVLGLKRLTPEVRGFLSEMLDTEQAPETLNRWFEGKESSSLLRDNTLALLTDLRVAVPTIEEKPQTPEAQEIALFTKFLRGETVAFNQVFSRFYPLIVQFLLSRGFDRQLASDSASDALIKVLEQRDRITAVQDVESQLFRIARNIATDYHRKSSRSPIASFGEISELDNIFQSGGGWFEVPETSRDDATIDVELAMSRLTSDEELVIRRLMFEGFTVSDVARELGRSLRTVRELRKRSLAKLKTFLREEAS